VVRERIRRALRWILDLGRATRMDVETGRDARNPARINVRIEAVQADGRQVSYDTFVEVI
jgi:phage gp46-like protein